MGKTRIYLDLKIENVSEERIEKTGDHSNVVNNAIQSRTGFQTFEYRNYLTIKIRRITRPRFAIRQKLTTLGIICVWAYEKVGPYIRLESKSNTFLYLKIHLIFNSRLGIQLNIRLGLSNSTSIHQFYYSAFTWLRSPTFSIRLNDQSRVGTLLRWYLLTIAQLKLFVHFRFWFQAKNLKSSVQFSSMVFILELSNARYIYANLAILATR